MTQQLWSTAFLMFSAAIVLNHVLPWKDSAWETVEVRVMEAGETARHRSACRDVSHPLNTHHCIVYYRRTAREGSI